MGGGTLTKPRYVPRKPLSYNIWTSECAYVRKVEGFSADLRPETKIRAIIVATSFLALPYGSGHWYSLLRHTGGSASPAHCANVDCKRSSPTKAWRCVLNLF